MTTAYVPCSIAEADGTPLGSRRVMHCHATPVEECLTVAVDPPDRLARRYQHDGLRGVLVTVQDGPPRPALVKHLLFDPSVGRLCLLRMLPR
jgi:hypothetical protein